MLGWDWLPGKKWKPWLNGMILGTSAIFRQAVQALEEPELRAGC